MADGDSVDKTTQAGVSAVGGQPTIMSPEHQLHKLAAFNNNIERIAAIESILMHDMGLSKADADTFIRRGVDAVFHTMNETPTTNDQSIIVGSPPDTKLTDLAATDGVWMNELQESFDESTYFIGRTKSVLVRVDGPKLTVLYPLQRLVPRLAFYDEIKPQISTTTFSHQLEYDMTNADVFLFPLDIPVKIRWLQRFPIAIKLKNPVTSGDPPRGNDNLLGLETSPFGPRHLEKDDQTLIFFARCDREKEEIFWKFIKASGKVPYPMRVPPFRLSPDMKPLDMFFNRLFGDLLVEPAWRTTLMTKIETKLGQVKKPHYLEQLKVTDFDIGPSLPSLGEVSKPKINSYGIWFELDFEFRGPAVIRMTTSLNPFKLVQGDKAADAAGDNDGERKLIYGQLADLYGNYEPDEFQEDTEVPEKSKSKLARFVEKIAESKVVQYFSEIGVIRKELEKIADADLSLSVAVEAIRGRMVLNIPNPPSDRLWYGFLPKPEVVIKATPILGAKSIHMAMITDFLENTLEREFHQVLTSPNFDDITIPFANSGIDPPEYRLSKLRDFVLKLT